MQRYASTQCVSMLWRHLRECTVVICVSLPLSLSFSLLFSLSLSLRSRRMPLQVEVAGLDLSGLLMLSFRGKF